MEVKSKHEQIPVVVRKTTLTLTLEDQKEIDLIYAIFNSVTLCDFVRKELPGKFIDRDIRRALNTESEFCVTDESNKIRQRLDNLFKKED